MKPQPYNPNREWTVYTLVPWSLSLFSFRMSPAPLFPVPMSSPSPQPPPLNLYAPVRPSPSLAMPLSPLLPWPPNREIPWMLGVLPPWRQWATISVNRACLISVYVRQARQSSHYRCYAPGTTRCCHARVCTEKNLHPKRSAFWQRRNIYQIMPRRKRLKGNFG